MACLELGTIGLKGYLIGPAAVQVSNTEMQFYGVHTAFPKLYFQALVDNLVSNL